MEKHYNNLLRPFIDTYGILTEKPDKDDDTVNANAKLLYETHSKLKSFIKIELKHSKLKAFIKIELK